MAEIPVKNAEGFYDVYLTTPKGRILKDSTRKRLSSSLIQILDTATGFHIQYENRQIR